MVDQRKPNGLLIAYLYAIQGIALSLPGTIILTYSQIPSYDVLSIFAAASLPFSFKFISAPILQTYTSNKYGRRKTWIVISCLLASLLMFCMSFFTADEYMVQIAVAFIGIVFLISLQDISTDALGVKELRNPDRLAFLQASMQQAGSIFGSLVFIKMVSPDFGKSFGFEGSIMSVATYFRLVALIILVPTLIIHFFYREERLAQQEAGHDTRSLLHTFQEYRIFTKLKYSLTRQVVMFLLYMQGLSVFSAGYQIQLVRHGFSKETITLINNFMLGPTLLTTYVYSRLKLEDRRDTVLRFVLLARVVLQIVGLVFRCETVWGVSAFMFFADVLSICAFMGDISIINSFPIGALSGMFITMLNSTRNLGNNNTLQLKIIGILGFETASMLGIAYSLLWVLMFKRVRKWIEDGEHLVYSKVE